MKAHAARTIEVFNEAKALPPGPDRERFLIESCGADELLRADVKSLLDADSSAESFMQDGGASPADAVKTEGPGDWVGRYHLLEKIGEGGCGIVYLAEQEKPVRRRVALKIIKLGMDTRQAVARFEAERQALALMDHPNIAKVFDGGATDLGRPYFVMELVRGIKVTDYCDQQRIPTEQRLALFIQVCQAVQHAHQKGVIHRDLKPSNILVTVDDDGAPVPKVIDFGIAKATEQRLTEHTALTALEQFIGTPAYMSPEQAASRDVDTRTDVYSLGVVLYELLTGCTPFDPGTLAQSGVDEIRRVIREKEPAMPSARFHALPAETVSTIAARRCAEPSKLLHRIRGDLDWIVMKCLEKDRSRRYETANGLVADLQRHCRNEPVTARSPGRAYRFQKMVRRNKLAVAATSAIAAALVIGLGAATWMFFKERQARERAEVAEQAQTQTRIRAEAEAARSAQVAQFMKEMLQGVGPGVARGKDTALLREIVAQTAARLEGELRDQPNVKADLRSTLGIIFYDLGDYTNAAAMHQEALALREGIHGRKHPSVASSLTELGRSLHRQNQVDRSESVYREALEIQRAHSGVDDADVANILVHLGSLLRKKGDAAHAEELLREALAIRKRVLGPVNAPVAEAMNNLGLLLATQPGGVEEAEQLFREALEIRVKVLGHDHFLIAATLGDLGRTLERKGQIAEAEAYARRAFDVASKVLEPNHPDLGVFVDALVKILHRAQKPGEAEAIQEKFLISQQASIPHDRAEVTASMRALSELLRSQIDWTQAADGAAQLLGESELFDTDTKGVPSGGREAALLALKKFASAQTLYRAEVEAKRARGENAASLQLGLARLLEKQGRFQEAEGLYIEALAAERQSMMAGNPAVISTLKEFSTLLLNQKKGAAAESHYLTALAALQGGPKSSEIIFGRLSNDLGDFYRGQRRHKEASVKYLEALPILRNQRETDPVKLLRNLAQSLRFAGKAREGEAYAREGCALAQSRGKFDPGIQMELADNLAAQGDWVRAEAQWRQVVKEIGDDTNAVLPLMGLARALGNQKQWTEADALFSKAIEIKRRQVPADERSLSAALIDWADMLEKNGRFDAADAKYREVGSSIRSLLVNGDPSVIKWITRYPAMLHRQGHPLEAENLYDQTLELAREVLPETNPTFANVLVGQAEFVIHVQGNVTKATELFLRALPIRRLHQDIGLVWALRNTAGALRRSSKPAEAEAHLREAMTVARNLRRETAGIAQELALALSQQGRNHAAGEVLREAVEEVRKKEEGNLELAEALANLATFHRARDEYADAVACGREALAIQRKHYGDDHAQVGHALHPLGWNLYMNGDIAEAESVSRGEIAIWRKNFGNRHANVAWALGDLSVFLRKQGRLADAEAAIREAVNIRKELPSDASGELPANLRLLADLLAEQGKPAEAP